MFEKPLNRNGVHVCRSCGSVERWTGSMDSDYCWRCTSFFDRVRSARRALSERIEHGEGDIERALELIRHLDAYVSEAKNLGEEDS